MPLLRKVRSNFQRESVPMFVSVPTVQREVEWQKTECTGNEENQIYNVLPSENEGNAFSDEEH